MNTLQILFYDYDFLNNRGFEGKIIINMENFFPCNETKFRKIMKWIDQDNISDHNQQIETMILFFERKKEESTSKAKAWYAKHYETLEQIQRA